MTKKYLPPLNALRVFEAAARHSSFKNAAAELNVTHGAVSQQVALLESILQVPLFLRLNRQIVLTDEGRRLMADIQPALDRIAVAVAAIGRNRKPLSLNINVGPTFALRWLIPRLKDFSDRYSEIEISLTTSRMPVDFRDGTVDVAIRRNMQLQPGVRQRPFLSGALQAVCSPLLQKERPIAGIQDLERHVLLHVTATSALWSYWAKEMGHQGTVNARAQEYDELIFAVQAAIEGLGIVIAPVQIIRDDIRAGRLVAPFGEQIHTDRRFRAFYTQDQIKAEAIRVFIDWLAEQGERTEAC